MQNEKVALEITLDKSHQLIKPSYSLKEGSNSIKSEGASPPNRDRKLNKLSDHIRLINQKLVLQIS